MAVPLIIAILCIVFTPISHTDWTVLCPAKITNGHIEAECRRQEGDSCAYNCAENCSKRSRRQYLTCRNGTWNTNTETLCSCKTTEKPKLKPYIEPGYVIFFGIVGTLILLLSLCCFIRTKYRKRRKMARLRSGAQGPIIQQSRQINQRSTASGEYVTSEAVPVQRAENGVQSRLNTLCNTVTNQHTDSPSLVQQATSLNRWSTSQTASVPRAENEAQSRGRTLGNTVASQYTNSHCREHFQEAISSDGSAYPDAPPPYSSIAVTEPEITPLPPPYEEAVSNFVMPQTVNS